MPQTCTFCLDPILDKNDVHETKCKHAYHKLCMSEYIAYQISNNYSVQCPLCRAEMFEAMSPSSSEIKINRNHTRVQNPPVQHQWHHRQQQNQQIIPSDYWSLHAWASTYMMCRVFLGH
jgi:Ring finger domain